MGMLGAFINVQFLQLLVAQGVAADHPLDGFCHHPLGMFATKDCSGGTGFNAARITGVPVIYFFASVFSHKFNINSDFFPTAPNWVEEKKSQFISIFFEIVFIKP